MALFFLFNVFPRHSQGRSLALPAQSLPFFGSLEGIQNLFLRQPLVPSEVSGRGFPE